MGRGDDDEAEELAGDDANKDGSTVITSWSGRVACPRAVLANPIAGASASS